MRESVYTSKIRDLVKDLGVYPLKLNLRFERGIADAWYSGKGGDLWVEYKWYASLPKTIDLIGGKNPKISKLQQKWLTDRHFEGRDVAVVVACVQGALLLPGLSWVETIDRDDFFRLCVDRKSIAAEIALIVSDPNSQESPTRQ